MLRTGLYDSPANRGKLARVDALVQAYQCCAATLAAGQWRLLFQAGRLDGNAKLAPKTPLSARYVQTVQYQVVGALTGFLGNCADAFKDLVLGSSLDEPTRVALLYLNKYRSWYKPEVRMQGQPVPAATLRLARNIMRAVLARHRKPNLRRCNLALDEKVAIVEPARRPGHFDRWVRLSTLDKGKPVLLPLASNPWFEARLGTFKAFVQLNRDEQGRLRCGLVKEVAPTPWVPRTDVLGLDVGLRVLLATSEGDVLGQHVLDRLRRLDSQISTLAANRQRAGLKVRSRRYDALVHRMREFLTNEVRRTLRQALLRHQPASVAIELLDFRSPELSRRMNRLVQNFGRTTFKKALTEYAEQYGFAVHEVEPAYSSQRCNVCGYVDRRNRQNSTFRCLHCRHHAHADVNAARNHALALREPQSIGRSAAARLRRPRKAILQHLVERFATPKRLAVLQRALRALPKLDTQPPRRHRPSRPMLSNPYFAAVLEPVRAQAAAAPAAAPLNL